MNEEKFSTLITQYNSALRAFALKFVRDEDEANDLLQDTVMKAIRFRGSFQEGTNVKGWLYTIMRNTFINNYRKSNKKNALIHQSEEINSEQLLHSASKNSGESTFILGDVNGAISQLPHGLQIPFIRFVEGYKYEDIAQEMNIPLGTVKTRIHQARLRLAKKLKMYKEGIN
ncbi:RNA polymerase sigma factor [Pedobacter sp.]|uniref:RNA polymerase sigma factor n=1 Tax=Pedobacter sp. TaxID=1411316 RepID=UPI003BA88DDC